MASPTETKVGLSYLLPLAGSSQALQVCSRSRAHVCRVTSYAWVSSQKLSTREAELLSSLYSCGSFGPCCQSIVLLWGLRRCTFRVSSAKKAVPCLLKLRPLTLLQSPMNVYPPPAASGMGPEPGLLQANMALPSNLSVSSRPVHRQVPLNNILRTPSCPGPLVPLRHIAQPR